jgi:hypothetical protein
MLLPAARTARPLERRDTSARSRPLREGPRTGPFASQERSALQAAGAVGVGHAAAEDAEREPNQGVRLKARAARGGETAAPSVLQGGFAYAIPRTSPDTVIGPLWEACLGPGLDLSEAQCQC